MNLRRSGPCIFFASACLEQSSDLAVRTGAALVVAAGIFFTAPGAAVCAIAGEKLKRLKQVRRSVSLRVMSDSHGEALFNAMCSFLFSWIWGGSMAVQACEQSEQGQARGKCKVPDMFPDHCHATSPDCIHHQGTLAKAAAGRPRRREMVFSFLKRRREKSCCQGAMALAAFSTAGLGVA